MIEILLAGCFTVFGAVLGGLISKYGLPNLATNRVMVMSGVASPIKKAHKTDSDIISIQFKNFIVRWGNRSSTLNAACIVKTENSGELICTLTGVAHKSHPYHSAVFFTELTADQKSGAFPSRGVILLNVTPPGWLFGEFVFEHLFHSDHTGMLEHFKLRLDRGVSD